MDDVAAAPSGAQAAREPGPLRLGRAEFPPQRRLVMAIVNRTPDSFYRPGATWDEGAALERVHAAVAEGADILDVGGVPFVASVRAAYPDLVISVDTWRHEPARAVCEAGADLLNDTWSGWDPKVADVTDRVLGLAERARQAGVDPARIVIDPAHDFGKNTWHSLELTRRLGELTATGRPVLLSASHKDFVGAPVEDRLAGTLAVTAVGAWLGARIFRAHDVRATRQALDMVAAVRGDLPPARAVRGLA